MLRRKVFLKKMVVWCLIVSMGGISACVIFFSCVSVWVGLVHLSREGFWAPVLAGLFLLGVTSFFFVRTVKSLVSYLSDKDMFVG